MSFELVPHTADIAIEATGADAAEAFANAGLGLTAVLTGNRNRLGASDTIQFTVEAPDSESLLVAFLSELLWFYESDGLLWTGGGVEMDGLKATVQGNAIHHNPGKHGHGVEVKAITYHDLESHSAPGGWKVRVVLDI